MKHIEEIQELPSRGGFMLSIVTDFGAVHETWYYREVKRIRHNKLSGSLMIEGMDGKPHQFRVYGDASQGRAIQIVGRFRDQLKTFQPMDESKEGYELCKRLASH